MLTHLGLAELTAKHIGAIDMKIAITLTLILYAGAALAQPRCVKWKWYNVGNAQKTVCLHWDKR